MATSKKDLVVAEGLGLTGFDPKGDVSPLIKQIDIKIAELKRLEDTKWKTPGKVDSFKNFKDMTTVEEIHEALSVAVAKTNAYNTAQELTGTKNIKAKTFEGATLDDLVADAKLRADQIQLGKKLETLKRIKTNLSEFITKEQRQEQAIKGMLEEISEYF